MVQMLSSGISMHGRTCFWKMESFLQCHHKSFLIPYQFIHFKTSITVEIPENREQTAESGCKSKTYKTVSDPYNDWQPHCLIWYYGWSWRATGVSGSWSHHFRFRVRLFVISISIQFINFIILLN